MIFLLFLSTIQAAFTQLPCDLNCHFTPSNITLETIKVWPKSCKTVCGDILINEGTNVTAARLGQIFHKLEFLNGSLKVENTNFTSLDFISQLANIDCSSGDIIIGNNPLLKFLNHTKSLRASSCVWRIINNPKLNVSAYIASREQAIELIEYGNLEIIRQSESCNNVKITSDSHLKYYTNCTEIFGLTITNVSEAADMSGFLLMKKLTGTIEIYGTGLHDLSFMSNMKIHNASQPLNMQNATHIHNNPNLKRLGWDSLEVLGLESYLFYPINMEKNHPDFCLSTNELQVFAEFGAYYFALEATVCPDLIRNDGQKVCQFGDLPTMDSNCQHVIGDVLINSDNENHVEKLKTMTNIYGTLTIESTKELLDLSFLSNFHQIATLVVNGPPPIRILSNKKLQNVTLSKMKKRPFPYTSNEIIQISGNSEEIFKNRRECMKFQVNIDLPVKYNGRSCLKLPKADGANGEDDGEWDLIE